MLRYFYHMMFYHYVVHSKFFKNLWHCFAEELNVNLQFELNSNALVYILRKL
jgi:hypothetical protein